MVEWRYVNVRTAQSTDRKPFIRYFLCKWTYLAFIFRLLYLFVVKKNPLGAFTSLTPTASVSGFYFGHPDARYFNLGKIKSDQLEAYADARSEAIDETRRWLAPVL